jgi:putative ABC transport system permease protein
VLRASCPLLRARCTKHQARTRHPARSHPALDDERRRYYRLTPFGRDVAIAEVRQLETIVVLVWAADPGGSRTWLSGPEIADLAQRTTALEGVAGLSDRHLVLTGGGEPDELNVIASSPELFPLLGVSPAIGRAFSASDADEHAAPVVILSHAFWQRRFGASPAVIGSMQRPTSSSACSLSRSRSCHPARPRGPASRAFAADAGHGLPAARAISAQLDVRRRQGVWAPRGGGRWAFGGRSRRRPRSAGGERRHHDVARRSLARAAWFRRGIGGALAMLALALAAVGVYGMLAFAIAQRRREFGVRLALGATPAGLVRLVMSDIARVVVFGLVVGLPAAVAVPRWARTLAPGTAGSDALTLTLAGAVTAIIALLAGYLPARRASQASAASALRSDG